MPTGSFEGEPSGLVHRDTYQEITTKGAMDTSIQFGIWNKNLLMKALGIEAFGSGAMSDISAFGKRTESGRVIMRKGGSYLSGTIFETDGTSQFGGRLASFNPELVEGGDEYAYSYHRLYSTQQVPDVDVQDNQGEGKLIDLLALKMEVLKKTMARDFNLSLLGNASAPNYGVLGPSAMNTSINIALGVTNATVGGISQAATGGDSNSTTYWAPQRKAITSIGGGGELDRPITLRRSLKKVMNDAIAFAETNNDYLLLCSQGAWQYMDRLAYADAQSGGNAVVFKKGAYDAADLGHIVFNGNPMVWDTAVATPTGGSATTDEVIYGMHIPSFGICFHSQEGFTLAGWEEPRLHDQYRTFVGQLRVRFTPVWKAFRPHFLAYNMPANND